MNDNGATAVAGLAEDALQLLLDLNPVGATLLGLPDRDDRLADYTEAGDGRRRGLYRAGRRRWRTWSARPAGDLADPCGRRSRR